ncbi:ABC transporter ATP-binding protein [Alkaliphilus serpentinus]|uniref:ABC transporter ATP-binding protein n=1 Tax=Alkaliphilus serpentinus TaxID=1482731 RepID=A0A833HRI1_9FIRM|nr:ABC transporter ATP-binding protein [Alkaliphilus serpentinus]KAB3533438.1 ABC transporter ATP-binding protein [Alkaliphilus serpentinus]
MKEILQISNLEKVYSNGSFVKKAVDNISFSVNTGEIFGLLGPNGAGKTSIIKCICGLLDYEGGDVLVNGYSMKSKRRKGLKYISAVLEGNRNIYWRMTVDENLDFFSGINGMSRSSIKDRKEYLLQQFQLQEQRNQVVNKLSRGMKQKVAIAISLITNKDIVLLDEPTLGLDVAMSHEMRKLLRSVAKEEGKTILLSTHDMNVVEETCDRLVIINEGQIIAKDTVSNLKTVFNNDIYQISYIGVINNSLMSGMEKIVVKLEIKEGEDHSKMIIHLHEATELFRIFEMIKEAPIKLISIDRVTKNLEGIFLDLLKEAGTHEVF